MGNRLNIYPLRKYSSSGKGRKDKSETYHDNSVEGEQDAEDTASNGNEDRGAKSIEELICPPPPLPDETYPQLPPRNLWINPRPLTPTRTGMQSASYANLLRAEQNISTGLDEHGRQRMLRSQSVDALGSFTAARNDSVPYVNYQPGSTPKDYQNLSRAIHDTPKSEMELEEPFTAAVQAHDDHSDGPAINNQHSFPAVEKWNNISHDSAKEIQTEHNLNVPTPIYSEVTSPPPYETSVTSNGMIKLKIAHNTFKIEYFKSTDVGEFCDTMKKEYSCECYIMETDEQYQSVYSNMIKLSDLAVPFMIKVNGIRNTVTAVQI